MPALCLRLAVGVLLLSGLAVLTGCSSRSKSVPVTGSVQVDGAPGSLTVLMFWPEDANSPPDNGGRVMTDDKGEFTIGEQEKGTGLLPGSYKVTFSRFVDKTGKAVHGGGKKSEATYEVPSKESMPDQYRDKGTTPVSVQVSRDSKTFTLEVATKPR